MAERTDRRGEQQLRAHELQKRKEAPVTFYYTIRSICIHPRVYIIELQWRVLVQTREMTRPLSSFALLNSILILILGPCCGQVDLAKVYDVHASIFQRIHNAMSLPRDGRSCVELPQRQGCHPHDISPLLWQI